MFAYRELNEFSWGSTETGSTVASMADLDGHFDFEDEDMSSTSRSFDICRAAKRPKPLSTAIAIEFPDSPQSTDSPKVSALGHQLSTWCRVTTPSDAASSAPATPGSRKRQRSESFDELCGQHVAVAAAVPEERSWGEAWSAIGMASETKPPKKLLALESLPPGQWWQVIEEECECSEGEEEGEVMEAVVDDYDVVAAIADYAASNPHPSGDEIEMQRDVIRECIRLKERQAACLLFASEQRQDGVLLRGLHPLRASPIGANRRNQAAPHAAGIVVMTVFSAVAQLQRPVDCLHVFRSHLSFVCRGLLKRLRLGYLVELITAARVAYVQRSIKICA